MKKIYFLIYCSVQLNGFAQLNLKKFKPDSILSKSINLQEVVVSDSKNNLHSMEVISRIDKELRPVNSAQDLLRLVPGLFISQHAGGGKAEQIFLRGFDCDHGTDFSVNIDGMPVNMVSHAHGQGYADFHFVIPETIDKLKVFKGVSATQYGDFATSGAGEFSTKNNIGKSLVKLDAGQFDTYRAVAMIDLLQGRHLFTKNNENFYVAGEYFYSNSFLENKQNFTRYNIFSKYSAQLNNNNHLVSSVSTYNTAWDASGQIPSRAVNDGAIKRMGSIDPTEGGRTSRTNANAVLTTSLKNGGIIKNQAYYSYYDFNLFSNFTFFLHDSVNGDQINQTEKGRNIYGYKFTYEKNSILAGKKLVSLIGVGTRIDDGEISLKHSAARVVLDTFSIGYLNQQNANAYVDETIFITDKFSINTGLRLDYFQFNFRDYKYDSLSGLKRVPKLSPKLNLYYNVSSSMQLYARGGYGFHSNDARSVVLKTSTNNLPSALGYETGCTFKPGKNIVVNCVLWGLDMQNELVYVGDEAIVEITGATRRLGSDFSIRYGLTENIFADADLNFSHGRYINLPEGENFIPLAPSVTSTGGLSYKKAKGLNCSVRYRYLNSRPANEDNTVVAHGYFLLDAVINYSTEKFQIGLSAENILNTQWNQAQFNTQSRLKNESTPVSELHYTPGTPFFLKTSLSFFF